jgi:lipoprotein-releasing system permease protein
MEDWQGLTFQSWKDQNPQLFAALKLERIGMLFLLSLLLMIASFTIFSLMSLTVVEKVRDMAILRTVGLSVRRVIKIFLMEAAAIGLLGDLIGGILGTALVQFFIRFPIRLPSAYYVQHLPLKMDPGITAFVLILSPCLALLAALYPALRAGRGSLTEIIRYE